MGVEVGRRVQTNNATPGLQLEVQEACLCFTHMYQNQIFRLRGQRHTRVYSFAHSRKWAQPNISGLALSLTLCALYVEGQTRCTTSLHRLCIQFSEQLRLIFPPVSPSGYVCTYISGVSVQVLHCRVKLFVMRGKCSSQTREGRSTVGA